MELTRRRQPGPGLPLELLEKAQAKAQVIGADRRRGVLPVFRANQAQTEKGLSRKSLAYHQLERSYCGLQIRQPRFESGRGLFASLPNERRKVTPFFVSFGSSSLSNLLSSRGLTAFELLSVSTVRRSIRGFFDCC
jgi:hypothetical protein